MPRKLFVPNDVMRGKVRSLAARGTGHEDIATIVGCDAKTLRKHLRDELDCGMAEANAEVTGSLFNAATTGGNVAAQIFWHKTRMHWREREAAEDRAPSTDADSTSRVVIYLPDNDRDPGLTEVLRKAQEKYLVRRQRKGQ